MSRRKSMVILPEVKVAKSGKWYVQYSVRDPETDKMTRFRIYEGFDDCENEHAKKELGQRLVNEFTDKLKKGWTPYVRPKVLYEDKLMYCNEANLFSRIQHKASSTSMYMSEFLTEKNSEVTPKTYQTYVSKFRLFNLYLKEVGKENEIVQLIDNGVIVSFMKHIAEKKKLSRLTMEKYQQILYTFFEYLRTRKKVIKENPVTNIPRVGILKDEAAAGLPERYRKRLQREIEKEDPQLWLCCLMQYYAAIRPGNEMRFLKVKDIDFDTKVITIRNYHAKNGRTEAIQMPDALYDWLIKYDIDMSIQDYYVFGRGGIPGPEALSKNSLRLRFNKFRDRLNLPKDVKLYSWKHSGAQELSNAGVNMYEISRHLRHKNITTTEHYTRKRLGPRSSAIKHNFPDI
ncbi:tyrosine-type recombinase/integrase [Parabacteroides sp. GYB001]|uniref:tyrosine-type recombinase/integrase n=1 Tax=Parabacteroides leei TaxID=2939491 RepID=UPI002016C63A|nr:tyrosine-type recombinase/integrase [Parabacteroides leei]MCL3854758.1 tyrosine-type recombinase/integrase [Parabacteroides leei]